MAGSEVQVAAAVEAGDVPRLVELLVATTVRPEGPTEADTASLQRLDVQRCAELVAALLRARDAGHPGGHHYQCELPYLVAMRQPAPVPAPVLALLLDDVAGLWAEWQPRLTWLLRAAGAAGVPVGDAALATARRSTSVYATYAGRRELRAQLAGVELLLNPGEAWADAARAGLDAHGPAWRELVRHAARATGARPSPRWDATARTLVERAGPEAVRGRVLDLLALVDRPRSIRVAPMPFMAASPNALLDPANTDLLRGLLWTLPHTSPGPEAASLLGRLAEVGLRKVPGQGPRSLKLANAAVFVLSRLDGDGALGQLARLATVVTVRATLNQVQAALDVRAAALGLSREEVEELSVPGYGLTEVGRRVEPLGECAAELVVVGSRAELRWRGPGGRPVKAAPAAVRREHPEECSELKAAARDISAMLTAQSERLDRMFLLGRTWRFADWQLRYLDHPLVGTLARRLIWTVDGVAVGWADGALRTADDVAVTPEDGAQVALWHPLGRPQEEVAAWRTWLERHEVTQPFKQAHREVYVLTPAEAATRTYSNRFAGHVLRQHQFHALAATRGWDNSLRIMADTANPPAVRALPQWGLRAEFLIVGDGREYEVDTLESGAYRRVSTDQVRFYPAGAPIAQEEDSDHCYTTSLRPGEIPADATELADVPPLAFSEVMRDVDLFVGVASVGNDPTWSDGGPGGRFVNYWRDFGFGELTTSARLRRETLERLLPRLAIRDRARLDGHFLHVRGELRGYKIHLNSANVLMEPDDRYLCIVPARGGGTPTAGVFLPFEGDAVLGLVLSKALLLADDAAITDPTIVAQVRRS